MSPSLEIRFLPTILINTIKAVSIAVLAIASTSVCFAAQLLVDNTSARPANKKTYVSIAAALPHLRAGDSLVIAPGIYRESIDLRLATSLAQSSSKKPTIIRAEKAGDTIIRGSDLVGGWERVGTHRYVKRDWSTQPEQVFVDGTELKQIGGTIFNGYPIDLKHPMANLHGSQGGIWPGRIAGGLNELVDGSFYYETDTRSLFISTLKDLTKHHQVEVSIRTYSVFSTGMDRIQIIGLQFEHANTTVESQSGAITMIGDHLLLDGVTVQHVDGNGIDITGNHNQIKNSATKYCGIVGLKVRGKHASVIGNETSFNNTRGFNKWWEAGGAKFVGAGGLQDSEIAYNKAYGNNGDGLWFDWHNRNNRIHHNTAAYNTGMGLHYEASEQGYIYDNYVFGNAQRGIYLSNSRSSVVAHNFVIANKMEGIVIIDDRNAQQKGLNELIPVGNQVFANVIAWNHKAALILPLGIKDSISDTNVFIGQSPPSLSLGWGSREHPIVNGLEAWRATSKQDPRSTWKKASLPPELEQQLVNKELNLKWEPVQHLTRDLQAQRVTGADARFSRPGAAPGPVQ